VTNAPRTQSTTPPHPIPAPPTVPSSRPNPLHLRLPSNPYSVISTKAKRSGETPVLAVAFAFAVALALTLAFLSVIPSGNLLLPLPFFLSFPPGICFCPCLSFCHSLRESASALAFLSVIPSGNLLLPLPFFLSFPPGICFCLCLSFCHSLRESASAFAPALPSRGTRSIPYGLAAIATTFQRTAIRTPSQRRMNLETRRPKQARHAANNPRQNIENTE
jgi:hypothetical protein